MPSTVGMWGSALSDIGSKVSARVAMTAKYPSERTAEKYPLQRTKRLQQHQACWTDHCEDELETHTGTTQEAVTPAREAGDGLRK
jgi:hypothetical protein